MGASDDYATLMGLCLSSKTAEAVTPRELKPYRDRAELFAVRGGKVFGATYADTGVFGGFGGGVDDGETPEEAAVREFLEETGLRASSPRRLDVPPLLTEWKPPYASDKQRERAKHYRGARTYYVAADLDDDPADYKKSEPGRGPATLYDIDEAIALAAGGDGELARVNSGRKKALELLRPKSGFGTGLVLAKRAEDDDRPFTVAVDLDGTLAEKEEPFRSDHVGPPIRDAVEWVRKFKKAGMRVIVFTVRGDEKMVRDWLDEHDVPYDFVNENPDQPDDASGKIMADVYWDDKAVNAEDPDSGREVMERFRRRSGGPAACTHVVVHRTTYVITAPQLVDAFTGGDE